MSQLQGPSSSLPYSVADHLHHDDHLHTAQELVVHMGKEGATTHAIYNQAQATRRRDDRAARFWSLVCDAICRGQRH